MPIFPWLRYDSGYTDAWGKPEKERKKRTKVKRTAEKTRKKGK